MPSESLPAQDVPTPAAADRLVVHRLDGENEGHTFAGDVVHGLTSSPKFLQPKYFYDELGSQLFEAICLLPEYYLTRAEAEILERSAGEIVASLPGPVRLLELGSGSSVKTRHLIEALLERQEQLHYLPLDISPTALERSAQELLGSYPGLRVTAFAADYSHALAGAVEANLAQVSHGRSLVLFLGSPIGNLEPSEAVRLLDEIRAALDPGDGLLLGADLKKDEAALVAAYDDALGVTAAFSLNLLVRINRELGADFDPRAFRHRAVWNGEASRMEMHLESRVAQTVRLREPELTVRFAAGEAVHTESSHKYDLAQIDVLAARTAFHRERTWTDAEQRFSVSLLIAE